MEGKRDHKFTPKAWELRVESLQNERKSRVNKMKNVIAALKECMKNDENISKVSSLLETLKLLKDDACLQHENLHPLLPIEEQIRQNEWFRSILRFSEGFIEDVEKWLCDLKVLKKSLTQTMSIPVQNNESLGSAHNVRDGTESLTMAAQGLSLLNDTTTDCVISQSVPNQSEDNQTCEHLAGEINPSDFKCMQQRIKQKSHFSGSRASRLSVSSAPLQAEAEMAALLASQQMLQQKHAVEEEEERLRKRKEQIELQTNIAAFRAKNKCVHGCCS